MIPPMSSPVATGIPTFGGGGAGNAGIPAFGGGDSGEAFAGGEDGVQYSQGLLLLLAC